MKLLWHDRSHELNSALINCNEVEFPSCSGGDLLFGHVRGYKTSPNSTEHVCGVCVRVCGGREGYLPQNYSADKMRSRCISIPIK